MIVFVPDQTQLGGGLYPSKRPNQETLARFFVDTDVNDVCA